MSRRPALLIGCGLVAVTLAGALVGAGWPASRSRSDSAPLAVRVSDAQRSACRNGAARWTVGADVITHGQPGATLSRASLSARYREASPRGWHRTAVAQTGDGFAPGRLIGPNGELRTHPLLAVDLPCTVTAARLIAAVRVAGEDPRRAEATFVDNGIAMSASSVGGLVLLLVVAACAAGRLGKTRPAA